MTTNEQVLDLLKKGNANKAAITEATGGIKGIQLFNLLKKMLADGQITSLGEGNETMYALAEPQTEEQPTVVDTNQSGIVAEEIQATTEHAGQAEQPATIVDEAAKEEDTKKEDTQAGKATVTKATTSRDNSKFKFNGEEGLGKGPLVRAIVAKYVEDHPDTTYKQLKEVFPDTLMKRFGVFANETDAKKLSGNKPRYFLKPEQMIKIKGQKEPIVICNQWTAALIEPFIKVAKELGYKIK